jgi:hypothetical protein
LVPGEPLGMKVGGPATGYTGNDTLSFNLTGVNALAVDPLADKNCANR